LRLEGGALQLPPSWSAGYVALCGFMGRDDLRSGKENIAMADERVMLTVILHHDQSKTLEEIMTHVKKTGFYRDFPPEGTEVVSWVVAMSFGFIMHLRVEVDKVRTLNRYMEQKAWGAFRYEVYPSYDFLPIAAQVKKDHA
jgi:hypothetical protein